MGAAFEVNRQMCDIVLLAEENIRLGKENQERSRRLDEAFKKKFGIKEDDMEKKTKKMTKAEAFEWLKYKKVILRTEDEQVELQRFLFNVGYRWISCRSVLKLYSDTACMFFLDEGGLITHSEYDQESGKLFCDTHVYKETKLDDILSIEIVEEKNELEFNYDKVVELAKPLMHYLNEVGFQDSIRVSQLGIVHEPVSTLIFDNGIGE